MPESYLSGAELIEQIQKSPYSRDLIGYHGKPPQVQWPNHAKIAVQFVLNYEEGGEKHIEHGDEGSEVMELAVAQGGRAEKDGGESGQQIGVGCAAGAAAQQRGQ